MTSKLTSEILDDETLAELIAFRRSRVEYCQKEGLPYQKALHDSMMLALEELQERRKADSEPVAWMYNNDDRSTPAITTSQKMGNYWIAEFKDVHPLYRHPQPAPVAYSDFESFWSSYIHPLAQDDELKGFAWDIWCAAMLQAGSSPVIPDGWTCNDKANAALMMLDRIETADPVDDDRIDGIKRIVRELAAAPHDTPALNSVQSVDSVADRWIPVSERMPEDEQEVLTINKMGHRFVSFFDKHSGLFFDRLDAPAACCIEHVLVTHWMPLPAAPQEVKGE
ncbi:DUF551 domain-containing protein [Klebsiella pneumoniae]|uniref:DUF551 domain-containing protein n=1 Tax=Klebsiella pneumoniae TaxID=573 RepID=UPI00241D563D|nr:DUF551 domain-containing protein [Klebsiella pneumoniae]MDG5791330.1 DUF551 domain-containing protein [Klebsiella pneumoniae]